MFTRAFLLCLALAALSGCATPSASAGEHEGEIEHGRASWYSTKEGRTTASGERLHNDELTAAHRHLPFGSVVRVTNLQNGRSVQVRITDRGPWKKDRILDVSSAAADVLKMKKAGTVPVEMKVLHLGSSGSPGRIRRGPHLRYVPHISCRQRVPLARRVRLLLHGAMTAPLRHADPGELFDVVDEADRVLGRAPRREVHARGLLHRAVHVLVHDAMGRLFLQRRSPGKDTFPDCWDSSCSGHLDAGEDYAGAARRELGEELGWHGETPPLRHLLKLAASPETGHEFIEIYLLGPVDGPFLLHPEEISEGRWVTPTVFEAELRKSPETFAGALRHLWAHHREKILESIRRR